MKHINHLDYSKYCRNHVLGNVEKNLGDISFQHLFTLLHCTYLSRWQDNLFVLKCSESLNNGQSKVGSVTRWLNCLFNIWQFAKMKIGPIAFLCPSRFKIVSSTQYTLKNIAKLAKFRQIWSHWRGAKYYKLWFAYKCFSTPVFLYFNTLFASHQYDPIWQNFAIIAKF